MSGSFFLSLISIGNCSIKEMDEGPWTSQLRGLLLCIIDSQETSSTGKVLINSFICLM